MNYISPGPGTIGHLVPELLARKENLKFTHVTYKGAGQAMTDLVAGHVKMGSVTWSSALAQIRAGTVLPLAVSSARPMPEFPAVPTMKALGYPDLAATTWFGFSGPAGIPKEIVARLNAEIVNALGAAPIRQRLEAEGIETEKMSADEFTSFRRKRNRQMDTGGEIGGRCGFGTVARLERRTRSAHTPSNRVGTKILVLPAFSRRGLSAVRGETCAGHPPQERKRLPRLAASIPDGILLRRSRCRAETPSAAT